MFFKLGGELSEKLHYKVYIINENTYNNFFLFLNIKFTLNFIILTCLFCLKTLSLTSALILLIVISSKYKMEILMHIFFKELIQFAVFHFVKSGRKGFTDFTDCINPVMQHSVENY